MTVEVLAWRVKSKYSEVKTLAMVKGGVYAIVVVVEANDYIVHKSKEYRSSAEAEKWLQDVTADGELVYGPKVFFAEEPPETLGSPGPSGEIIHSSRFKEWVEGDVLRVVDRNILNDQIASATFTFGEPQPAFTR